MRLAGFVALIACAAPHSPAAPPPVVPARPAPAPAPAPPPPPAPDPLAALGTAALPPDAAATRRALAAIEADVAAGKLDAAEDALAALAAADLPLVAARLADDAALAPIKAAMAPRLAALAASWRSAIERGAPVIAFAGTIGSQQILEARVLRPGVWVASVHRFFPLAPPVAHASAGVVDLAHRHAITVALRVDDCRSDFCPRIERIDVDVWSLDDPGTRLASWSYRDSGMTASVTIESVDGGARANVNDCGISTSCHTGWIRIQPGGARPDKVQRATPGAIRLEVDQRGDQLALPSPTLALDGRTLHLPDRAIELDKRHRVTDLHCIASDASYALVTSTVDRCECNEKFEGSILVHAVDRVELATGHVDSISSAKLGAVSELDRDGAVYLQVADKLTRYPSIAAMPGDGERLPDGFLLAVGPLSGRPNCCGL
ncbi:MAG TPA: hypothetical protein VLX92_34695 [Kofleriaceae bacterium]|nr:hypothetical protein [Kofleriaceae bacterium]